jgi:hypothetical protein
LVYSSALLHLPLLLLLLLTMPSSLLLYHRALARGGNNKGKGNPKLAQDFAGFYGENFSPETFTIGSTGTATQGDYQLVCDNPEGLEKKLFTEDYGPYATCFCDPLTMAVYCSFGDPQCLADTTSYCAQDYYWWAFSGGATTAAFHSVTYCKLCVSGDCLSNPTVFDGYCSTILFQDAGMVNPSGGCIATFASEGFAVSDCNINCQVCRTRDGWWGIAPSSTLCSWWVYDGCEGDPFLYDPFVQLRSSQQNNNIAAIASGVVGVTLFLAIGGGIYYYLYYGRFPWQKSKEAAGAPSKP